LSTIASYEVPSQTIHCEKEEIDHNCSKIRGMCNPGKEKDENKES